MFSMQFITNFTIKTLFWEAEIFLKTYCSQNAGNAIWETQILKLSLGGGGMPPSPPANLCLRHSAHTVSNRILSWGGGQGKSALCPFFPTTGESLKMHCDQDMIVDCLVIYLFCVLWFCNSVSQRYLPTLYCTTVTWSNNHPTKQRTRN
jgi:hypothetical protein